MAISFIILPYFIYLLDYMSNYPFPRPSVESFLLPSPQAPKAAIHNPSSRQIPYAGREQLPEHNFQLLHQRGFQKQQQVFDTNQYPMYKMISSPYKLYEQGIDNMMGMSKKREFTGSDSSTITLVSSHEPIKPLLTQSDGGKKGMLSSLESTNSNRKSKEIRQLTTRQEYGIGMGHANNDPIFYEFQIIKEIGEGKFSKVSVARHLPSGMVFGLKTIKKKTIADENLMTQLLREIKILSFIEHPNIVSLYKVFNFGENIYLVEELGCDGELYGRMSNHRFSEEGTSFIMRGLLSAVSYLHSHNIIHRDIKPENVVIVHGIVKLCDLGWSVHTKSKFRETFCGTPLYASPQLLQGTKYNEKIDLWALGVMAFELRYGFTPFNIKTKLELHKIITDDFEFPATQTKQPPSEDFQHFVKTLLQKNPKQRLTAQMMLKHPFILNYKEFQTCEELCSKRHN